MRKAFRHLVDVSVEALKALAVFLVLRNFSAGVREYGTEVCFYADLVTEIICQLFDPAARRVGPNTEYVRKI